MKKIFIKTSIIFNFFLFVNICFGQGNPGFMGKKIALGYNTQFCILRSNAFLDGNKNSRRRLTNNDFYVEVAISKYRSLAAHFSNQTIPLYDSKGGNLKHGVAYNNKTYLGEYKVIGGSAEFKTWSIGLKYSLYSINKTISAPVGFCQYFRIDVVTNEAINNNFDYELLNNSSNYPPGFVEYAKKDMTKSFTNTKSQNVSFGYGVELKTAISKFLFIRLNGEINIASSLYKITNEFEDSYYPTLDEDMQRLSRELNATRNIFLFGIGIGILL